MVGVVFCSRELGVDPDNVATPLAAALGDLTTLALLTGFTSFFWSAMDEVCCQIYITMCMYTDGFRITKGAILFLSDGNTT